MQRGSLVIAIVLALAMAATAPGVALAEDPGAQARTLFKKGQVQYNLGEYRDALAAFREAYRLKDDPVFLYNIAQCHRQLGENSEALRFYRTYLRAAKGAPNRAEVERKIQELERAGVTAPPPSAPAPIVAPTAPAPSPTPQPVTPPAPSPVATPLPAASPPAPSPEPAPYAQPPAAALPPPVWLPPPRPAPVMQPPATNPAPSTEAPPLSVSKPAETTAAKKEEGGGHVAIWVLLGLVVAGGAAAAFVLTHRQSEYRSAPMAPTDLGTGQVSKR